ncbi:YbaB/EbfC family DNA-binding protein [Nocardia sp. SYP-A9097]|uniref:YbaB/EbfC family nucleoid-associated protein n=1 Tax=Nocardia sp. SYP-A9097 TaxID=2663237 RepID=UPI00129A3D47|nr:YbaB/EbfC family nucleoid-associated protein [Nocardia sp. SYP-A9097]MRH89503.1 YbaB/EbfC family DNA-binding protein [Nocardia sp. SYP-A9097]
MANEAAKGQLAELMELVQGGIASISRAQQERARLTATAHAAERRVTITVNADCIVIKTEFSDDIDDLEYSEIAAAVTAATQDAAAKVQEKAQKILDTAQEEQSGIPTLSEFFPAMPDIRSMMPTPPTVSTAPPGSVDRTAPEPEPAVRFTNVEEWDHDHSGRSSISAPEW